jgi:uncharacterized protein (DUF1697 family)
MKPPPTREMLTIISMLRGVNLGGHNQIKMDALRALYQSLELKDPQTYVQSGNVVFKAQERKLVRLAEQIENAIEKQFGFRPGVVLRTASDLKDVVARNPFAKRRGIDPRKLGVVFFNQAPAEEACDDVLRMKAKAEEVHISGREFYIYFPNGMGQSKLFAAIAGKLKSGTTRNWNTVTKLLEMAETLDAVR